MISIIIATLNEEKCIKSTLKSLINQDYKGKYEIIVADGMSKDNTVKIARKYADKVALVKKRGVAVEKNGGAKLAKGDILLFLDADVTLLSNALSEISKPFENKKVVGVACTVLPLSKRLIDFMIYWIVTQYTKITIKINHAHMGGQLCVYRKDTFKKAGGFDEKITVINDYDLSKKISKLGKMIFINKPLALVSTRRIKEWGILRSTWRYLKIYINYILLGKGANLEDYKPVR